MRCDKATDKMSPAHAISLEALHLLAIRDAPVTRTHGKLTPCSLQKRLILQVQLMGFRADDRTPAACI